MGHVSRKRRMEMAAQKAKRSQFKDGDQIRFRCPQYGTTATGLITLVNMDGIEVVYMGGLVRMSFEDALAGKEND